MTRLATSLLLFLASPISFAQDWFLRWTQPPRQSLVLATVADLARSKSELIAENAVPRHKLVILTRQVQHPRFTRQDRFLLVFLASRVRTWKQAFLILKPDTCSGGSSRPAVARNFQPRPVRWFSR